MTLPAKTKYSVRKKIPKYLKISLALFLTLLFIVVIIINTQAGFAADIADNYLRPLIGTSRVIFLEQLFFGASDKAAQLKYKFKSPTAPEFLVQTATQDSQYSPLNFTSIPSLFTTPLNDEGIWHTIAVSALSTKKAVAYTFVRPDPTRSFAVVSLVQMDLSLLHFGAVAGTLEPGGSLGNPGSGMIPQAIIKSGNLVAAFEGGFLYVDGNYGMIVSGKTYAPLKNGLGTIVGYTDGSLKIINYTGQDLGKNVSFARQNGPLLIDNGKIMLDTSNIKEAEGRVLHGGIYTWRSAIGLTKSGNVIYAAGNNLSPTTLADALQMAGVVNAIQLDINPAQVRFDLFNKNSAGSYDVTPLNKELASLSNKNQYLDGYTRDFFYVYKK
jgi:hypothetical protein